MPNLQTSETPIGNSAFLRRLTIEHIEEIEAALMAGKPRNEIATLVGVSIATVNLVSQQSHPLQRKRARKVAPLYLRKKEYEPSPEEIEAACAAIRMARPEPEPEPWLCPGWEYGTPVAR